MALLLVVIPPLSGILALPANAFDHWMSYFTVMSDSIGLRFPQRPCRESRAADADATTSGPALGFRSIAWLITKPTIPRPGPFVVTPSASRKGGLL
ncbi:hypothetical protein [Occultella kanbiaonis]|uniref:hypothetical protein n=1 Tax=Occultella kanbiaonis TaxID=2675754 RepID=UPI0013D36F63|nr:hypothetical protein [Occultella kanbiaonis]